MNIRTIALTGIASLAGLGLVGAGAHAVFTTSAVASQTVAAGTPGVVFWSTAATNGCTTEIAAVNSPSTCQSIPLTPVGPVGSTFDSTPVTINEVNVGNIPLTETTAQLADTYSGANNAGAYLQNGMDVCITSNDGGFIVVANGPLTTGTALSPSINFGPTVLTPYPSATDSDAFTIEFYAGQNTTDCGTSWSVGSHTASVWSGAGTWAGPWPTPNPWVMPASLVPQAEGGAVTVTISNAFSA